MICKEKRHERSVHHFVFNSSIFDSKGETMSSLKIDDLNARIKAKVPFHYEYKGRTVRHVLKKLKEAVARYEESGAWKSVDNYSEAISAINDFLENGRLEGKIESLLKIKPVAIIRGENGDEYRYSYKGKAPAIGKQVSFYSANDHQSSGRWCYARDVR